MDEKTKKAIEEFRLKRIKDVIKNKKGFPNELDLNISSSFFIHIIPSNFSDEQILDLTNVERNIMSSIPLPIGEYYLSEDSLVRYRIKKNNDNTQNIYSYNQIFENGIYEIYTSSFVFKGKNGNSINYEDSIKTIIEQIQNGLEFLEKLQIPLPFFICLSLLGIKDVQMTRAGFFQGPQFNTNESISDPVFLETFKTDDLRNVLNPVFEKLLIPKN